MDIKYLCMNLGNLSGMPVRLYEKDKLVFYYSIVSLPVDPLVAFADEVLAIVDHVGYFITPHENYYGVVNFGDNKIVLGPTRQIPLSEKQVREIAFDSGVPHNKLSDFTAGMKSIVPMPLGSVLQTLFMVNHVLNDGEKLNLADIAIADSEQESISDALTVEEVNRAVNDTIGSRENPFPHNTLDVEEYMLDLVKKGDVAELKRFFSNIPALRSGIIAHDDLRQSKNLLIISATLISRSAIREGMNPEEALTLSESYMRRCELMTNVKSVTNLNYRLIMDFTERMKKLRYDGSRSKLVIEVNNYIRKHVSEPITVEKTASALCRGRSRLSTDFKKETGENLSVYIMKQKIEEAKKLLRYSNKPAADIAFYLGFSSQSHFSRTFKKYASVTPNEYRNSKDRNILI